MTINRSDLEISEWTYLVRFARWLGIDPVELSRTELVVRILLKVRT